VVRRLRQADVAARPFFLMIHYVPPHEPYAPDPEFDVFGDPAYDGPVTSDRELAQAVYDRKIELDESDLAEMVALYDGNLRMADAAVGRVLAGLKDAGRYDDALVIVTSDHGEAFLEHGWMGHNKTIYEEMLRVPLIVKLPRSWEPPAELDLDRLVTLADVPATILRRLGLEAPAAVRGLDLLDGDPPERALYLRSAKKTDPWLGVRTRRWKAIWGNGSGELYDLAADPGETVDVIAEHPLLRAGLALLLSRAIRAEEPLRAGARAGEISEEDRTMLRALGYL
jgi:arylsulfatase A-like enzyme